MKNLQQIYSFPPDKYSVDKTSQLPTNRPQPETAGSGYADASFFSEIIDNTGKHFFYFITGGNVALKTSVDKGKTWTDETITPTLSGNSGFAFVHPLDSNIYYFLITSTTLICYRSKNGIDFELVSNVQTSVTSSVQISAMFIGGSIYVYYRVGAALQQALSINGGATWTKTTTNITSSDYGFAFQHKVGGLIGYVNAYSGTAKIYDSKDGITFTERYTITTGVDTTAQICVLPFREKICVYLFKIGVLYCYSSNDGGKTWVGNTQV